MNPLFGFNNRLDGNDPRPGSPVTNGMRALRGLIAMCQRASTQRITNKPGSFPNGKRPTSLGPKRKSK